MESVEKKVDATSIAATQTKNAIVGTYDESGTVWKPGIRDNIQLLDHKVDTANEKADKFLGRVNWGVGVLTAIFVGLCIELGNSYFGWWGSAHQILQNGVK